MIKATGKGPTGRDTLFVGLSFGNLDKFRAEPLDTFIMIQGSEVGLPFDVMIFSGETEAQMADLMAQGFGPDTKVIVADENPDRPNTAGPFAVDVTDPNTTNRPTCA